uniref:Uncharacterized protein n=2 Tax=Opuntia streptacantha TaxID=393608 RepID=A0A7C9DRA1_OPUST
MVSLNGKTSTGTNFGGRGSPSVQLCVLSPNVVGTSSQLDYPLSSASLFHSAPSNLKSAKDTFRSPLFSLKRVDLLGNPTNCCNDLFPNAEGNGSLKACKEQPTLDSRLY